MALVSEERKLTRQKASGQALVQVADLRKEYKSRRGGTLAVDGISFEIGQGELVGLLGPNGAGKSTTIKCICTLVRPTSGTITVGGYDVKGQPNQVVSQVASVLEGNRNIFWRLTPRENLDLFAAMHGIAPKKVRAEGDALLERFDLTEKANVDVRKLSRGMQQKVAVACAFIKGTPLLLLDEPTLGLDVETSLEMRALLKEMAGSGERTIVISSHDMAVIEDICERVIIINQGHLVTDEPVSGLLNLFRARAYRFELASLLDENCQAELRSMFPQIKITSDLHSCAVEAQLQSADEIFSLIEVLRSCGAVLDSIDRQDPDLEEIFLRIVRGESK